MSDYSEFDDEYDIDEMVEISLDHFKDSSASSQALSELWPDASEQVWNELMARLANIANIAGFFTEGSMGADAQSPKIDLSVLKPGFRPIPSNSVELINRLDDGTSGFGAVWRGRNPRTQRDFVLKFSKNPLSKTGKDTLHNELRLAMEMNHPAIVKLLDEGLDAEIPFLIYEFIDGIDLSKLLEKRFEDGEPMPADEAAGLILKIADIVSHAHTRPSPVVHRDLKPQNILVANHHDLDLLSALKVKPDLRIADLRVMDFGIGAHCNAERATQSKASTIGAKFDGFRTLLYSSPQQSKGLPADRTDDVYALGVFWYQLLTGSIDVSPTGRGWSRRFLAQGMTDQQIAVLDGCRQQERKERIPNAVELARKIRKYFPAAETFAGFSDLLQKAIASFAGDRMVLDGVRKLTPKAAAALAAWKPGNFPKISLNGLTSLTPEIAAALAKWNGESLNLNGLTSLTPEIAAALTKWTGRNLYLNGLTSLTPEVAAELAQWKGERLYLNGLTSLTPEVAAALAKRKENGLYLNGLTSLTPEVAAALAKWEGYWLHLTSLTNLTSEVAAGLAEWKGNSLELSGLTTLTPEVAVELAKWKGEGLDLDGLTTLTPETAAGLANWKPCDPDNSELYLNGLASLTPKTAASLAKWKGMYLYLNGVTSLTPETATELATWEGDELELNGLTSLSPEAAASLAKLKGELSFLSCLTSLTPETASALAKVKGDTLNLSGLTSLAPESAEALAKWKGTCLYLDRLTSLTPETAAALARWKGRELGLDGVDWRKVCLMDWIKDGRLLHTAAEHGGLGMAMCLICHAELDFNQKDEKGWSPLLTALKHGQLSFAKEFIECFEDEDGKIDLTPVTPGEKETPLHLAAKAGDAELVKLLLQYGLNPKKKNARGQTALHYAVESGNIETIRLLVPSD